MDTAIQLFWVSWPVESRRLSKTMPVHTTDGLYLTAWPWAAAILPPAAIVLGVAYGWGKWGFQWSFTESLSFLLIALILGLSSANLGVLFLAGFAFAHFFLGTDWVSTPRFGRTGLLANVFLHRVPLMMLYGLLALLIVKIPVTTKQLLVQIPPPSSWSRKSKVALVMIGHALLTGLAVYFWLQTMPVLVRPVFTWVGLDPSVDAVVTLQEYGFVLIIAALATSAGRIYLQSLTAYDSPYSQRVDALEQRLAIRFDEAGPVTPMISGRLSPLTRCTANALLLTLLLSGLYEHWIDAVILFVFSFGIQGIRHGVIPVSLGRWPRWIEGFPLLYRMSAGFLIILLITRQVLNYFMSTYQTTFRPVTLLTGLAMVILFILNPGLDEQPKPEGHK